MSSTKVFHRSQRHITRRSSNSTRAFLEPGPRASRRLHPDPKELLLLIKRRESCKSETRGANAPEDDVDDLLATWP